ncbi:serine hydrolase domain-containing protein [Sphaerisporangium sp. NPDC005289]|uniref:serine hydrolase domain-containing protein n=1 Tax=Sphaerisporangium sp. NPDC005289 TaxID=3155247 RepID=UPI0033BCFE65
MNAIERVANDRDDNATGPDAGRAARQQGEGRSPDDLREFVEATATRLGIPGVAVGVWAGGQEAYAYHGVTSVDNPLPVDQDTLYEVGSVSKTFTATALMRLAADGRVALEAPVRRYVPELVLSDERAAAEVTVAHLLNHTSGLDWAILADTGEGDDALAAHVAQMAALALIAPPGTRASYSQAGYNLAGRVVEKVTGLTYERAVASLVLEPLGLSHSLYDTADVMTRRFAVGHNPGEDGAPSVARGWRRWRANNPGGGLMSSVADQIRWARFHLGDGRGEGGARILPAEALHRMRRPTVELRGSTLGDAFGICWFLRDVDGVRTVGHGGSANGQFAELLLVPERDFAVVSLSNAGPNGIPFNQAVVRWALEHYLGVVDRDPRPLPHDPARAREVAGRYDNDAMTLVIVAGPTGMTLEVGIKPEIRAASDGEMPPDYPPAAMGLLPGDGDEYIITEGGLQGQRGFFTRDEDGAIVGIDLAGRMSVRVATA